MSWLDQLAAELGARGVPGPQRRRIVLELRDHIECEPGCEDRLGDPGELATSFADELATSRARGSAFWSVGALALAALALVTSQLAIGRAGGHPGYGNGISIALFIPALLGMLLAPQVALVAGSLAALRAARRRSTPRLPAAEIALIERRTRVALAAGLATVGGLALYLVNFAPRLPGWYLGLVGALSGAAAVALLVAFRGLTRAQAIVSGVAGPGGDVFDDIPIIGRQWLRRRPWRLGVIGSLLIGIAAVLFTAHAERSLIEGLERGIPEALALALGFALLGRVVGLRPEGEVASPQAAAVLGSGPAPIAEQLAGDRDRSDAELILRESFAAGRLSLEELTRRASEVHEAETIGQLRHALRGLRPRP
jgi:hypothetical protein